MRSKNVIYTLLIILAMLVLAMLKLRNEPKPREVFDRSPKRLEYTKHGLCRMDCRRISKQEIMEVMKEGVINLNKSDRRDRPCPTYALQGRTDEGDYIRVVFAQCADETKVVTCYNLEKDFECHCPGDNK